MNLDVEAVERATLAAVPPSRLETLESCLLPLDDGTVGRAHSAVPTRHSFDSLRSAPAAAACRVDKPTSTLVAQTDDVAALPGTADLA